MIMTARYEHAKPCSKLSDDPFYEAPYQKAFYHPTCQQKLSEEKKWVALSSLRGQAPPDPRDIHFLRASHTLATSGVGPDLNESPHFDETWPTSERPSTVEPASDVTDLGLSGLSDPVKPISSLIRDYSCLGAGPGTSKPRPPSPYMDLLCEKGHGGQSLATPTTDHKESTLSKYIDRFRHGTPLSREQREKLKTMSDPSDFWWIGSATPQSSSTPRDPSSTEVTDTVRTRLKGQHKSTAYSPSESTRTAFSRDPTDLDSETMRLLHKTDRLLERSESSLSSTAPVVSTDGLGSDTSVTSSGPDRTPGGHAATSGYAGRECSYLPAFVNRESAVPPRPQRALRREDDILYQWRQQRKVEAIRSKASQFLDTNVSLKTAPPRVDDVESKLAHFRHAVYTRTLEGAPLAAHADHLTSLPAEMPETKRVAGSEITAPSKANAVIDAVCQTSPPMKTQTSPDGSPKKPEVSPDHAPIISGLHKSLIASPSLGLQQKAATAVAPPGEKESTEPHFHLACDIIPCPQHHHHHGVTSPRKQKRKKPKSYHSDTDTDESRSRHHLVYSDEEPVKDSGPAVTESCSDLEYKAYKEQHMEELQFEMGSESETRESQNVKRDDTTARQEALSDRHVHKPREHARLADRQRRKKMPGEEIEKRTKDRVRLGDEGDNDRRKRREDREDSGREFDFENKRNGQGHQEVDHIERHRHSVRSSSRERNRNGCGNKLPGPDKSDKEIVKRTVTDAADERTPKESRSQPKEATLPVTEHRKPKEVTQSANEHRKPKEVTQSATEHWKPKFGWRSPQMIRSRPPHDEAMRQSGGSLTDASITEHKPLCHSSPIQRTVTPTIKQVVTERLFSDSAASASVTEMPEAALEGEPTLSESSECSGGEEFCDDELLQELRARRENYRQQLRLLEQQLALMDDA